MKCPACGGENTIKVIAAGLPMKMCNACDTLWGEPFASIYTYCVVPIENALSDADGFYFMSYTGNYFVALWHWFFDNEE